MEDLFNIQDVAAKLVSGDSVSDNSFRDSETPDRRITPESDEKKREKQLLNKLQPFLFSTSQVFQYPLNVGESEEQPHSVRFYINARSNSRVAENTKNVRQENWGPLKVENQNKLLTVDSTAENRLTADENKAVGKVTAIGVAAATIPKLVGAISKGASPLTLTVIAGGSGYLADKGADALIETTSKVRTLGAIELYVAAPPVAQYSANWENKELGALAGMGDIFKNGIGFENLLKAVPGIGELGARGAIKAAANLPGGVGISGELGASIDLATGKVANPYKEQLFSNMGFRQFAFNYKFNPRNKKEYDNVQRIIQLFKYHMHPEVSPNRLFLEYPSEFEIEYHYNGRENKNVSKISTCALTDVKITYGNQDAFTTIKDMNGAPAEINMQLAFTELETLTNERIADGY
jgi:hypothetical protein